MSLFDERSNEKLNTIIFGTDTKAGRAFDLTLVFAILGNATLIIVESVDAIRNSYQIIITILSWLFAILFTIEYVIRIIITKRKKDYILSFYGILDLLAILPFYLSFILPSIRFLVVIRVLRLLRIFSILKMGRYMTASSHLLRALMASSPKIIIFLFTILFIIVIIGSLMYIVEGPVNGFNSIPESMYWAIVTITTVGYGDISPQTPIGKLLSSLLMIIAYGILAVPTGIISHELSQTKKRKKVKVCKNCKRVYGSFDDYFCSKCGKPLEDIK